MRLQKFMSECGVASRRKSEILIENGAVKVNGRTAKIGDKVNPKTDKVYVHNKRIVIKNQILIMIISLIVKFYNFNTCSLKQINTVSNTIFFFIYNSSNSCLNYKFSTLYAW